MSLDGNEDAIVGALKQSLVCTEFCCILEKGNIAVLLYLSLNCKKSVLLDFDM